MSNVSRGSYYYTKSKKFLEAEGYHVEKLEKLISYFAKGKMNWSKTDCLFSDLMAFNEEEFMLVQVKGGICELKIKKATENYQSLRTPNFIKKVIMVWRPRVKVPELIEIDA
jgi:hypothetical protein